MLNSKKQLRYMYAVSAAVSFQIAGASWVALLAARGFSMVEIGLAEGVFHLASFLFEVPSGIVADVFGRKRALLLSQCMFVASSAAMLLSDSMAGVLVCMVLSALGYNFSSGSREALAYESLKAEGREKEYDAFAANEMMIWRIGNAAATLCAGLALWMGWRRAYLVDLALNAVCLLLMTGLREPPREVFTGSWRQRVAASVRESIDFLIHRRQVRRLMLFNAVVGAVATMLLFLLQARLPAIGLPSVLLGPALFCMGLGGAVGSQLVRFTGSCSYRRIAALCAGGVLFTVLLAATSWPAVVCAGGFCAGLLDDLLQVRTDIRLNSMCPSQQRATLLSVSSLCFSLVMLGLAPAMGALFSAL